MTIDKNIKNYKFFELRHKNKSLYVLSNGYIYSNNTLVLILNKKAMAILNDMLTYIVLSNEYMNDNNFNCKFIVKFKLNNGKHILKSKGLYIELLTFIFNEHNIKKCLFVISKDVDHIVTLYNNLEHENISYIYNDTEKKKLLNVYLNHLIV